MSDLLQDHVAKSGPVECLGQTFLSDEARREHYLKLLAEKLKDPAFRKIEGFPIGSDEDILTLSDPPYYTACPNPFISDFLRHYGKPYNHQRPTTKSHLLLMSARERMIRYTTLTATTPRCRLAQLSDTS